MKIEIKKYSFLQIVFAILVANITAFGQYVHPNQAGRKGGDTGPGKGSQVVTSTYLGNAGNALAQGVIISVNKNGTNASAIHEFGGFPSDASYPFYTTPHQASDGKLYGSSFIGGTSNWGAVYQYDLSNCGESVIYNAGAGTGGSPGNYANINELSDGKIYSIQTYGGTQYLGGLYRMDKDGSNVELVHSFSSAASVVNYTTAAESQLTISGNKFDGLYPYGYIVEGPDGKIYGSCYGGGSFARGAWYRCDKNGGNYEIINVGVPILRLYENGLGATMPLTYNIENPWGNVAIGQDNKVYITGYYGGSLVDAGGQARMNLDGSGYQIIHAGNFSDGYYPYRGGIIINDRIYGTFRYGGGTSLANSVSYGVVYSMKLDGTDYHKLKTFDGIGLPEGAEPWADLSYDGQFLYGTTLVYGGAGNIGTIFKIRPNGNDFQTIHRFSTTAGVACTGAAAKPGMYNWYPSAERVTFADVNVSCSKTCIPTLACNAGSASPTLNTTTISNSCPTATADLTNISASNIPSGTVIEWHTGTPATGANKVAAPTAITTAGTYYAVFYDPSNGCLGDGGIHTTAVTVSIGTCCPAGSTAPFLSSLSISNTCPSLTVDLTSLQTGTSPSGSIVQWHSGSPTGTVVADPTIASTSGGPYYAAYFNSGAACSSPAAGPVVVTAISCTATLRANVCAAITVDLTGIITATPPSGTVLKWKDSAGMVVTDPTAIGTTGTYYPVYFDATNNCFGNLGSPVTVTISPCADTDGDGVPDTTDLDDDNDGISDAIELAAAGGPDSDSDGVPNNLDLDSDNDGINDVIEGGNGALDTDGDGTISDTESPDANNDGIGDTVSTPSGTELTDPYTANGPVITGPDTDGDGIKDSVDGKDGFGDAKDTDGDGVPDTTDLDDDNDGISDVIELLGAGGPDSDGDGVPNNLDLDSDNDGINDVIEGGNGALDADGDGTISDTESPDANNDGIGDTVSTPTGTELTDPYTANGPVITGPDTDGDGIKDSVDGKDGFGDAKDTDGDGVPDTTDLDDDNDGISDVIELLGAGGPDSDGDGVPNNLDLDSDNDGINDVIEGGNGALDTDGDGTISDTESPDANNDGIGDTVSTPTGTELTDPYTANGPVITGPDTDGDGIKDSVDGKDGFGDAKDTDGDGVPDITDLDDDNDGISDAIELAAAGGPDSDGDGVPNNLDLDSDNDGINDVIEGGNGALDADGDGTISDTESPDANNDGLGDTVSTPTGTELTDPYTANGPVITGPDTDGDGIKDSVDGKDGFGDILCKNTITGGVYLDTDGIAGGVSTGTPIATTGLVVSAIRGTTILKYAVVIGGTFTLVDVPEGPVSIIIGTSALGSITPLAPAGFGFLAEVGKGQSMPTIATGDGIISMITNCNSATYGKVSAVFDENNFIISPSSALPVNLISFNGRPENDKINLNWKATLESNFSHYEIQKSIDGKEFGAIGKVISANSTNYNYTDTNPVEGINYYRLKMMDIDGTFKLSKIINVKFDKNAEFVQVQNPANLDEFNVFTNLENVKFTLFNAAGKQIEITNTYTTKNSLKIKVANPISGTYFLIVESNGKIHTKKVIIP